MVYDYLITLKKPDYKIIDLISQFLYLAALGTFIFFASKVQGSALFYWVASMLLIAIYIFLQFKLSKREKIYYTPGLAIAALTFLAGPYTNLLLASLYLISLFIERELKFEKEVGFTQNEIVFNTLFKKHLDWTDFNNIMIKDGLLTLDYTDNRLLQKEIDGDISLEIEKEFNEFCHNQIIEKTTAQNKIVINN